METKTKAKLFTKMVNVLKSVKSIKKSGVNTHQGYQYMTEADIIETVREELIANNIFIFSSVENIERSDNITTVKVKHTFVDGDSGEEFSIYSGGQGFDKLDKGIYKAVTGAMKYMLSKNLLIATKDDPEADGANKSYIRPNKDTDNTTPTAPKKGLLKNRNHLLKTKTKVKEPEVVDEQTTEENYEVEAEF